MLHDPKHSILYVDYQATGTLGRIIQSYGPKGGYMEIDGKGITIKAGMETIGGYSAYAGQKDLLNFIKRIWRKLQEVRIVHGGHGVKHSLKNALKRCTQI